MCKFMLYYFIILIDSTTYQVEIPSLIIRSYMKKTHILVRKVNFAIKYYNLRLRLGVLRKL